MSEYKLPDAKKEPVKCLVLAYKVTKGVPHDDRAWDKVHWARASKAAKDLLDVCGGLRQADSCLVDIAKVFDEKGLSWTIETVVKHAHDWIAKKKGPLSNAAHLYRARLFKAIAEQSGSEGHTSDSQEIKAISNPLRSNTDSGQAI